MSMSTELNALATAIHNAFAEGAHTLGLDSFLASFERHFNEHSAAAQQPAPAAVQPEVAPSTVSTPAPTEATTPTPAATEPQSPAAAPTDVPTPTDVQTPTPAATA